MSFDFFFLFLESLLILVVFICFFVVDYLDEAFWFFALFIVENWD